MCDRARRSRRELQSFAECLIEQTEAHVLVLLFLLGLLLLLLFFFLFFALLATLSTFLFLLFCFGWCSSSDCWCRSCSSSSSSTQDEVIQVLVCQDSSEERWPEGLELDISSLQQIGKLVCCDGHFVIMQNESSIGACKFTNFRFSLRSF